MSGKVSTQRRPRRSASLKGGKHHVARRSASVSGRISLKHLKSSTSDDTDERSSVDSHRSKRRSLPAELQRNERRKSTDVGKRKKKLEKRRDGGRRSRSSSSGKAEPTREQRRRKRSVKKPGQLVLDTQENLKDEPPGGGRGVNNAVPARRSSAVSKLRFKTTYYESEDELGSQSGEHSAAIPKALQGLSSAASIVLTTTGLVPAEGKRDAGNRRRSSEGRTSSKLTRAASIVAMAKEMAAAAAAGNTELPGRKHRTSKVAPGAEVDRKTDKRRDWVLYNICIMIFLRCLICLLSTAGSVFLELGDSANTALWIIHMIHWFASYVILFSGISYNRFTPVFLLFALFLFTGLTNIEEGENLVTNMLQQGRVNETAAQARREAVAEQQNAAADYDYYGVPDRTTSFREARDATRRLRVWDEYSPPPVPADIKAEERRKRSREKGAWYKFWK